MKNNEETNLTFIARGRVKLLSGGPEMSLVGLVHPVANKLYSIIKNNLTSTQEQYLAEKIVINNSNKIGFYPKIGSDTFYGHIFNQNGVLGNWHSPGGFASTFKCLCRYFSDASNEFIYKVFSPLELEFIENKEIHQQMLKKNEIPVNDKEESQDETEEYANNDNSEFDERDYNDNTQSYEEWLSSEFGDDAETAYLNMD